MEIPTNIKQIGTIGEGMRIYVEDYVCTYLQQYCESAGYEERLAILVGKHLIIDNQMVLFISGAIQGIHTKADKGITTFTEQMWDFCREEIRKYFKGLEIVGWAQSQPGFGTFLNTNYSTYHINNFTNPHQVLFVIDPVEKVNTFFCLDKETGSLAETRGYFIYYDKNRGMHEYMLNNKVIVDSVKEIKEKQKEVGNAGEEIDETPLGLLMSRKKNNTPKRANAVTDQRKTVNMLVSLSAVLLLVCVIMGAGLIQSDERISLMEKQLTQLNTAYRDLLVQIKDGKTEAVFAAQSTLTEDEDTEAKMLEALRQNTNEQLTQQPNVIEQPIVEPIVQATPEPVTTAVEPVAEPIVEAPQQTPEPTPQPTSEPATNATPEELSNSTSLEVPDTYTVEKGDNLGSISFKFYGTTKMIDKIMEINDMDNPDTLFYGKVIKLPKP